MSNFSFFLTCIEAADAEYIMNIPSVAANKEHYGEEWFSFVSTYVDKPDVIFGMPSVRDFMEKEFLVAYAEDNVEQAELYHRVLDNRPTYEYGFADYAGLGSIVIGITIIVAVVVKVIKRNRRK